MYVIKTTLTIYFFPRIRDFSISRSSKWTGSLSFSRGMCTHSLLAHFNPPTQSAARETDVATILSPSIRQRTYLGLARRELLESPYRPLPSPPQPNLNRIESHESRAVSSDHRHQSGGESASWQTMLSWFHITNHNDAMITTQVWSYRSVLYSLLVPHFVDSVITRGTMIKTRTRHTFELTAVAWNFERWYAKLFTLSW